MSDLAGAFAAAPPQRPECLVSVALPARDEAQSIVRALTALTSQHGRDGAPFEPNTVEILVFANNCTDATAALARAFADRSSVPIHVADVQLPAIDAHIGTARKAVMDASMRRFARSGRDGALLTTDADSRVAPAWIANTLAELRDVDAVTGRIVLEREAIAALTPADRTMLATESAYQFALTELAAVLDPSPDDPWPRHWQHFGGSFAVRASVYAAAGGIPPVPMLEDVALYEALLRHGARIRHSLRVRVATSGRHTARVAGGLGTYLGDLHALAECAQPLLVEHPFSTRERLGGGLAVVRPRVPMEAALAGLRDQIARVRAMAAFATRNSAASGAG